MANEVATVSFTGANLAKIDISTLKQGFDSASARIQESQGNTQFLKMTKQTGEWVYGKEDIEVEPNSRWAINPLSLEMGFIAWGGGGKPLGKLMRSIFKPPIRREELQDVGKEWDDNVAFQLKCMSGEDVGVSLEYTQNSKGGQEAFAEIFKAIQNRLTENPASIVPVVVMKSTNYKHPDWGLTYKPVFEIVDWMGLDGSTSAPQVESQAAPEKAAPEPEQAPSRRRFAATTDVDPAPATAPAAGAGDVDRGAVVRRRRRVAA